MNNSKKHDSRAWDKWRKNGSVGTIEKISVPEYNMIPIEPIFTPINYEDADPQTEIIKWGTLLGEQEKKELEFGLRYFTGKPIYESNGASITDLYKTFVNSIKE